MNVLIAPLATIASVITREYARSMQPWSRISMEVVRRRTPLMIREATVRKRLSLRLILYPPTQSWPASTMASSFGISSGGFWRSASSVTTTRPRTRSKAAMMAMCCP
jgi:hypothetical protein